MSRYPIHRILVTSFFAPDVSKPSVYTPELKTLYLLNCMCGELSERLEEELLAWRVGREHLLSHNVPITELTLPLLASGF